MVNLCSIKKRLEKNVVKLGKKIFEALSADSGSAEKMSGYALFDTLMLNSKKYMKIMVIPKAQGTGGLAAHTLHADLGRRLLDRILFMV